MTAEMKRMGLVSSFMKSSYFLNNEALRVLRAIPFKVVPNIKVIFQHKITLTYLSFL